MSAHQRRRLERQIDALTRRAPRLRGLLSAIRGRPGVLLRVPLGAVLVAGGFLAILPVFGLWMVPLGLLLLAIDLPVLRPAVSAVMIRSRRRWALWRRRGRRPGLPPDVGGAPGPVDAALRTAPPRQT